MQVVTPIDTAGTGRNTLNIITTLLLIHNNFVRKYLVLKLFILESYSQSYFCQTTTMSSVCQWIEQVYVTVIIICTKTP